MLKTLGLGLLEAGVGFLAMGAGGFIWVGSGGVGMCTLILLGFFARDLSLA